jgi:hypothetical protein
MLHNVTKFVYCNSCLMQYTINTEAVEIKLSSVHMYILPLREKISSKFISFHNMDANQCLKTITLDLTVLNKEF